MLPKNTGLEQTLKVAKGFLKTWRAEKTSLMLAEDYVAHIKKMLYSLIWVYLDLLQKSSKTEALY
jgi:hypothetical protein